MKNIMPKPVFVTMAFLLAGTGGVLGVAGAAETPAPVPAQDDQVIKVSLSTADHTKFKVLQQDFKTGPDVTRACLTCHTEASLQVHKTYHWTWESREGVQKGVGKKNVLNNF